MAAPQLAGLYALLLSSNPLLTVESTVPNYADSSIDGIRDLVATTARAVDSNNVPLVRPKNSWFNFTASLAGTRDLNKTWGAGIPRAKVAMEKIMGTVGGTIAKHRLTPLFVVRQLNDSVPVNYTVSNEFAYATAPSVISSFLNPTNGMAYYSSVGPAVRGFSGFLLGGNLGNPPPQRVVTPAAEVFVLANNYREGANPIDAQGNAPALPPMPAGTNTSQWQIEPLYSMVKCRTQRVANDDYSKAAAEQCVTPPNYGTRINIGGNSLQPYRSPGFESLLALEREVTALNNQGYELRGKVGFVVACKPSETGGCTPLSAPMRGYVQVTRACVGTYPNLATFDCAFTPLANIGTGNYASYSVSNQPTNVGQMPMTYAWENTHSDADDLIDGQEFILGTNPTASNTDGDGYTDSEEWPISAVSGEEICFRPIPCDPTLGECLPAFAYLPGQKDPLLPCGEPY